jgi:hypothetical protein
MKITVDLPDTPALAIVDRRFFEEALVATLYSVGKLSAREACETLDLNRRAFEELLPHFGFAVMPDDEATIDLELNA